ncbi:MAG: TetR/AcrR family transcriptional regulator [Acidobacteriota bacterium]
MAGRPSNRDERYAQVMEALVRCVARFGLKGATLGAVAEEAGLSRPLIRHHLGNRDEILTALQDYVLQSFSDQTRAMMAALPETRPATALIALLFSDLGANAPDMILAFAALTTQAAADADLREACRDSLLTFEAAVAQTLQAEVPGADEVEVQEAAHGITALYFNVTSLSPLDMPKEWLGKARRLSNKLLGQLKDSN